MKKIVGQYCAERDDYVALRSFSYCASQKRARDKLAAIAAQRQEEIEIEEQTEDW